MNKSQPQTLTRDELSQVLEEQDMNLDQLIGLLDAHVETADEEQTKLNAGLWLIALQTHRIIRKHCE